MLQASELDLRLRGDRTHCNGAVSSSFNYLPLSHADVTEDEYSTAMDDIQTIRKEGLYTIKLLPLVDERCRCGSLGCHAKEY